MSNAQVVIAPISCTLANLVAFAPPQTAMETIFHQAEPFAVQVSVEFGRSGAIALLPLGLTLRVDFFAKPFGRGDTLLLGCISSVTKAGQQLYTLVLTLPDGPTALVPEKVYAISALLQVGAPNYPALINGTIEGLMLQTYQA